MKASEAKRNTLYERIRITGNIGAYSRILTLISLAIMEGEYHVEIEEFVPGIVRDLLFNDGYEIKDNVPLGYTTIMWGV